MSNRLDYYFRQRVTEAELDLGFAELEQADQNQVADLGFTGVLANAVVSQHAYLCTGSHDYTRPTFDLYAVPIHVESETWLAASVFVGPGVTVGRGAMVGACSLVLKDVPAGMICAGNPLRVLRQRPVQS